MSKIFFTNKVLPNFHVEINNLGVKVWISLNIEPAMKRHLYEGNVYKTNKMFVYALKKQLTIVNSIEVEKAREELLNTAMINLREAKKKVLDDQINNLKALKV